MAEQTRQEVRAHLDRCISCGTWDPASGEWIHLEWKAVDRQDGMEESITAKAIVLACAVWGSRWVGLVRVSCDNTGAVSVVNS